MIANSIANARSKGDANFTTTRYEIPAFLRRNILIGIHSLPQVSMRWESEEFVASEGLKTTMPRHRFFTTAKYIHLRNPNNKDASDLLSKVRPLVILLERKFAQAFVPGKNIAVNEFNGRLLAKR